MRATAVLDSIGSAGWAAIVTVAGSFIAWLTTRGKNKADIAKVQAETSIAWIRELTAESERLREMVEGLEAEVAVLDARNHVLVDYLRSMGLEIPPEADKPA